MLPAIRDCNVIRQDTVGELEIHLPVPYRPGMTIGTAEAHHLNKKLAHDAKLFLADWLVIQDAPVSGQEADQALFAFLEAYTFESPPPALLEPENRPTTPITVRLATDTLAELRRYRISHGVQYNRLLRAAVEMIVRGLREDPEKVMATLERS